MAQEFLPLCDVLFNIISLASYFCDIVFDVVTIYTLYASRQVPWFYLCLSCIMVSLLVSQVFSLKWHFHRSSETNVQLSVMYVIHLAQFGVLWRYFKLFMPVDLAVVKYEVRDLCMLRLIHAFCEAAPMLLIQLFLIWQKPAASEITDLNLVSTFLSLFSVCWALASFSKNVRRRNIHKLVLTWLGVIFQFFWRLGTVCSRVAALTLYATLYHYWVFLVISLHWLTMFLWLISPRNVFHGEPISMRKKLMYSMLIAFVYIFCYINVQEINSKRKMVAFYVTMFLENSLLMAVFLVLKGNAVWYHDVSMVLAWGGFLIGIGFMFLYYKFFHIQHLKHMITSNNDIEANCADCMTDSCETHDTKSAVLSNNSPIKNGGKCKGYLAFSKSPGQSFAQMNGGPFQNGIPGVFNCRLNPALKRKKKKPSSFIPPPHVPPAIKTLNPFWKRLPVGGKSVSSDHESSIGSRVNIQQKLQEKKQQQLQELREIEEEMKQGKLKSQPLQGDQLPPQPPIPPQKRPPLHHSLLGPQHMLHGRIPKNKQRSQTPEILLVPDSLDLYCEFPDTRNVIYNPHIIFPRHSDVSSNSNQSAGSKTKMCPRPRNCRHQEKVIPNVPSDLDSQISLPRSYTLPREFRYYRRPRPRKNIRTEHFVASTNSSDGDVDSGDENEAEEQFPGTAVPVRIRPLQVHRVGPVSRQQHETQL